MEDIIEFSNPYEKAIYRDFLGDLTLRMFHDFLSFRKTVQPDFNIEDYKRMVINHWFEAQTKASNNTINSYNNKANSKLREIETEDLQIVANRSLTNVKKVVEYLLQM